MFYISSRGSTATTWVAKVLSKHPKIVCFRATKSFPPEEISLSFPLANSWIHHISPEKFIEGLFLCSQATLNEKIFGSIHGYHGISAKKPCEDKGGKFVYIIRHPLSRIHSVLIHYFYHLYYIKYNINIENKDIHNRICSLYSNQEDFLKYKDLATKQKVSKQLNFHIYGFIKRMIENKFPESFYNIMLTNKQKYYLWKKTNEKTKYIPDEKIFIIQHFTSLLNEFFNYDNGLFNKCSTDYGIKMEDIVDSKDCFKKHLLKKIVPELNITNSYLDSVFEEPCFNKHRDNPISPEQIWKSWPIGIKRIFLEYFEKYNMQKICNTFNYDTSYITI